MDISLNRRQLLRWGLGVGGAVLVSGCQLHKSALWRGQPAVGFNVAQAQSWRGPLIASTRDWQARPAGEELILLDHPPTRIIIHHTATPNVSDRSVAHAYSLARTIQNAHQEQSWSDTGQQFTVSRGGVIMEGRHRSIEAALSGRFHVRGSHCEGFNSVALGIENEGTYNSVAPPSRLYSSLVELCAWLCRQYNLSPTEIYGHRDFGDTFCPGERLYRLLPQLRYDAAARLGLQIRVWPTVGQRQGSVGSSVKTAQYFLRARGYDLPITGRFGPQTAQAVSQFQRSVGLTADQVIGSATWEKLFLTVQRGDTGEAVWGLQQHLLARGYRFEPNGFFGPSTQLAVQDFQRAQRLPSGGVVGPRTWLALIS